MPVVDASVVVDWVAPDADDDGPALQLLTQLIDSRERVLGPRLLIEEVTNALLTGCRRRRWDGRAADTAFTLLRRLPVELCDRPVDLDRAYELSRRYDEHPVYDMVYVALADRLGEPLLTADSALVRRLVGLPFVLIVG
jgi:predicted nucleic acid-binding protein